jgi:two-component system, OmpR family, sensor histidine kinase ArlS
LKLQVKLALYNAISKAIIILAIGALLPLLIERVVYNHIDRRLNARMEKTMRIVEKGGVNEIVLDQDCSFESYNIFKEEFLRIIPLPRLPVDFGKSRIENSERPIGNEFVKHRVLSKAIIYDNQLYEIEIGEGLSAVAQLNLTIRSFILIMLGAIVLISIALDFGFVRLLLKPFNKIVNEKLRDIRHPSTFNPQPIKTSTYEFTHLDKSINDMMRQIKEAFEMEREFIMNVSHELLTPVSILRNRIENLISDPSLPHDIAEKMVESQKTLARLTKVVKALLYISKIENEQFVKKESTPLSTVMKEVLEELEEWTQTKGITVVNDLQDEFNFTPSNRSLIHTLFYNLISNAIKYNSPGGKIMVSGEKQENSYLVKIADTGIGIASDQLAFIFDRFRRFRPADDMSYGLGLPIVKTISEFHGIDIVTESEKHRGTTFILKFPMS